MTPRDVAKAQSPALQRWIVVVLLSLVTFLVVLAYVENARIEDWDELWHLATGRIIVATGSVPTRDPFTFTAGDTPWVNTNWLAQVILWQLWARGGIEATLLLGCALVLAASWLAQGTALGRVRSAWAAVPSAFLVLRALMTGSAVRPQGWTFFLLAVTVWLIERLRERPTRARTLALALVLALSIQLHGGFVFLFVTVGIELAGELVDLWAGAEGATRARASALAFALAVAVASAGLHPHGYEVLLVPARFVLDPRIAEPSAVAADGAPPTYPGTTGTIVVVLVLLLLATGLGGRSRLRLRDVILGLAFLHLTLHVQRGVHYLAIVSAGPLAVGFDGAIELARARARPAAAVIVSLVDRLEPAARAALRGAPGVVAVAFGLTVASWAGSLKPAPRGDTSSPKLALFAPVLGRGRLPGDTRSPGTTVERLHERRAPDLEAVSPAPRLRRRTRRPSRCLGSIPRVSASLQRGGGLGQDPPASRLRPRSRGQRRLSRARASGEELARRLPVRLAPALRPARLARRAVPGDSAERAIPEDHEVTLQSGFTAYGTRAHAVPEFRELPHAIGISRVG